LLGCFRCFGNIFKNSKHIYALNEKKCLIFLFFREKALQLGSESIFFAPRE